ncbi:NHL repeat-containing protein [Rhodococcus marinonascens]|uniref:NHL repeat-containing protein n=1 Tax=Rhodococcus marinonascens TaxID=38311 RepID=UPI000ADC0A80|nr:NHL repeat-containing protein [Rhodococcus marinonascens]
MAHGFRSFSFVASTAALLLAAMAVPITAPSPVSAQLGTLSGHVRGASGPLESFSVTAWSAGDGGERRAHPLGSGTTDADGRFVVNLSSSRPPGSVLYLLAENTVRSDPGSLVLASVLGSGPLPADVVVNERTTVASAFAMAQFVTSGGISGPNPGITNAAGMVRNLVDVATGEPGAVLVSSPNGAETSTMAAFNSLSNMLSACVTMRIPCDTLLDAATPPGEPRPVDTFRAMSDVARGPANAVLPLFGISMLPPRPYLPALDLPPAAWTLALRFNGDGHSLAGPGNFAIDEDGYIWVNNNYQYNPDPRVPVCGGDSVFKFSPTGQFVPGSPFKGGGLSGAGFGITIDPNGDVWVGNYGFAAQPPGCPEDQQPPHNSVSKFTSDGQPLSPPEGFTEGAIDWPQGTIADRDGNIWMANCGSNTLTRYPDGDPSRAENIDAGLARPFGMVDNGRHVFATGMLNNAVAVLDRDGTPLPNSPVSGGGLNNPMGIASDGSGNVWVANSSIVQLPCPDVPGLSPGVGSITLLNPDGSMQGGPYMGGGLTIPWGIAADGDGNVWVANFGGKRLSNFCGTDASTCPPGMRSGDPISPAITGYAFDGLERNTGVAVDPSGNVWLANNWLDIPVQTNPGAHEIVAYVGLAAPLQSTAPAN